jgi:hypothetical protein
VEPEHHAPQGGDRVIAVLGMAGLEFTSKPVRESSLEVLRWLLFFVLALFLIIYGIFWLTGRAMPWPTF